MWLPGSPPGWTSVFVSPGGGPGGGPLQGSPPGGPPGGPGGGPTGPANASDGTVRAATHASSSTPRDRDTVLLFGTICSFERVVYSLRAITSRCRRSRDLTAPNRHPFGPYLPLRSVDMRAWAFAPRDSRNRETRMQPPVRLPNRPALGCAGKYSSSLPAATIAQL